MRRYKMEQAERVRRVIEYLVDKHKDQFTKCGKKRRGLVIKKILNHPKMQHLFKDDGD